MNLSGSCKPVVKTEYIETKLPSSRLQLHEIPRLVLIDGKIRNESLIEGYKKGVKEVKACNIDKKFLRARGT